MKFTLDKFINKANFVCSSTNSTGDLIAFGEEIYNMYLNTGNQFIKYRNDKYGQGFIAYKIKPDEISISEILMGGPNRKYNAIIVKSMLQCLSNDATALNRKIVYESNNKEFEKIIRDWNQALKDQKVEDLYFWKIK